MSDQYAAGRDFLSAAKLNYFHYVLSKITGGLLDQAITSDLAGLPLRIADLGTQTAAWPIDIACDKKLDVFQIDGFDISPKFYPPRSWLPSKVTLHVHDITTAFDRQFIGQFDVVHLRLFLTLSPTQVSSILENALTLLKPGGHLQWTEHDKGSSTVVSADPEAPQGSTKAFLEMQLNPFPGYNHAWIKDIAPAMAAAGFVDVSTGRAATPNALLKQMDELHLLSLADIPSGLSAAIDGFREAGHVQGLEAEQRRGVSMMDAFLTTVGRKPRSPSE